MEWIVLVFIGWLFTLYGVVMLIMLGDILCPREELGYKCRRGSGQKCECEE